MAGLRAVVSVSAGSERAVSSHIGKSGHLDSLVSKLGENTGILKQIFPRKVKL